MIELRRKAEQEAKDIRSRLRPNKQTNVKRNMKRNEAVVAKRTKINMKRKVKQNRSNVTTNTAQRKPRLKAKAVKSTDSNYGVREINSSYSRIARHPSLDSENLKKESTAKPPPKLKPKVCPVTKKAKEKRLKQCTIPINKAIGTVQCTKDKWVLTLDFSKLAVRQVKVYISDKNVEVRGLYRTQRKMWKNIIENYTIPDNYPCVVYNTKNGVWTIVARDCKGKCAWHRPEWPFPNGFKWPWEGRPNWPFENKSK